MSDKAQIRRRMRRKRRALSLRQRDKNARGVTAAIGKFSAFCGAKRVAIFAANDGEIDLSLIPKCYPSKAYYLPIIPPAGQLRMRFARCQEGTPMGLNRFGILEPQIPFSELCSPWHLDLILTPLVAFDHQGRRIGMGGGYYDATFTFLRDRKIFHRPRLVGVAHSFQQVEKVDMEPWDVPLEAVVTEKSAIEFR